MRTRRQSRAVHVGSVTVGGGAPISVQSMLNIPAHNIEDSVRQALDLQAAGCDIIRAAVPDMEAVKLIAALKEALSVPVVADIHFDYRLAVESVAAGVDKIRINPGNIGAQERVEAVVKACRSRRIPIRIGVNSGSLEKDILAKYDGVTPEGMAESVMRHVRILEKHDFEDIVLSIKSSDVYKMIEAYKLVAAQCDYPLHLGVTEAGTYKMGLLKSAVGIGSLLTQGIGDTIRVSLTDAPVKEVEAGWDILRAIDLAGDRPRLVSCPTCGRTKIDLISLANRVEERLRDVRKNLTVAVMGCAVNGPGEAREADIGIAGGDGCALIFKKGQIIKKVPESEVLDSLMEEIDKL